MRRRDIEKSLWALILTRSSMEDVILFLMKHLSGRKGRYAERKGGIGERLKVKNITFISAHILSPPNEKEMLEIDMRDEDGRTIKFQCAIDETRIFIDDISILFHENTRHDLPLLRWHGVTILFDEDVIDESPQPLHPPF